MKRFAKTNEKERMYSKSIIIIVTHNHSHKHVVVHTRIITHNYCSLLFTPVLAQGSHQQLILTYVVMMCTAQ